MPSPTPRPPGRASATNQIRGMPPRAAPPRKPITTPDITANRPTTPPTMCNSARITTPTGGAVISSSGASRGGVTLIQCVRREDGHVDSIDRSAGKSIHHRTGLRGADGAAIRVCQDRRACDASPPPGRCHRDARSSAARPPPWPRDRSALFVYKTRARPERRRSRQACPLELARNFRIVPSIANS